MDIQPVAVYHYTSQSSQQVYSSGSVGRANCHTCGKTMIRRVLYKLMDASQTSVYVWGQWIKCVTWLGPRETVSGKLTDIQPVAELHYNSQFSQQVSIESMSEIYHIKCLRRRDFGSWKMSNLLLNVNKFTSSQVNKCRVR